MSQVQEKDNFWVYIVIAVIIAVGAVLMVKKAEQDKYASIVKASVEDFNHSADRNDVLHSSDTQK